MQAACAELQAALARVQAAHARSSATSKELHATLDSTLGAAEHVRPPACLGTHTYIYM